MNILARAYHYLVWLFVISLPLSKAVNSVSLAFLFVISLLVWLKNFRTVNLRVPALIPVLFVALYLPSLAVTDDLTQGMWFIYRQNIYLTLPFSLYIGRSFWLPHYQWYFKWFILAAAATSAVTLIFFALPESTVIQLTSAVPGLMEYIQMTSRVKFGLYSPFIDRLHFAYLLGMGLFCLIYFFMLGQREEWQIFSAVTITVTFLLLGGRGAQLGLLFGAVVWISRLSGQYLALHYPQWSTALRLIIKQGLIVFYLVSVPLLFYHLINPVKSRYQQLFWELKLIRNGEYRQWDFQHFTSLRRLLSLKHHVSLIKQHPWLGTGVGDFRADLAQAYASDPSMSIKIDPNANNKFLFIWANAGLLGIMIFFYGLFWLLKSLLKIPDPQLRYLAMAFIIFILVSWLFDIFTVYQVGASFFCFFSTLFLLRPNAPT